MSLNFCVRFFSLSNLVALNRCASFKLLDGIAKFIRFDRFVSFAEPVIEMEFSFTFSPFFCVARYSIDVYSMLSTACLCVRMWARRTTNKSNSIYRHWSCHFSFSVFFFGFESVKRFFFLPFCFSRYRWNTSRWHRKQDFQNKWFFFSLFFSLFGTLQPQAHILLSAAYMLLQK